MSKAVLVMDMPKSCCSCNMCNSNDECILQDEDANFKASDSWEELRKGCPLRELPEKKSEGETLKIAIENDCYDGTTEDKAYFAGYDKGYNACIDELLKEE